MNVTLFKSEENALWYWRIVAKNNRIIAQSEGYQRKDSAIKGVRAVYNSASEPLEIVEK